MDDETWKWDSLSTWLEQDDSTYWIRGKAGSGKSTLMAHVLEDDCTSTHLNIWADGRELHILSFFFWRPGTELQKSIIGFLRSLLYEICTEVPLAIESILSERISRRSVQGVWTEQRLKVAICKALEASDHALCLFIDGLDEFTGDYTLLVGLISDLGAIPNVKCCVSSRPEVDLLAGLSSCKQQRLESLNYAYIHAYVKKRVSDLENCSAFRSKSRFELDEFIQRIIKRASGVFLWVVLAVPMICKGARSGDTAAVLHDRLRSLPTELRDVFAHMIARIDVFHKKFLAFYLQVAKLQSEYDDEQFRSNSLPMFPHIVCAQINAETTCNSYDDFVQLCEDERYA